MTHKDQFLHPDRLFPAEPQLLKLSRGLYESVVDLPIISPHGHTEPSWFADNRNFDDATSLLLTPDHYVLRLLFSHGIRLEELGVPRLDGTVETDARTAWRRFAENYHLFLGTPSRLWIDHSLNWAFALEEPLCADNADAVFDHINSRLRQDDMKPMALLDKANVACIATTEFALDPLAHHSKLRKAGLIERIKTTYRPDDVTDPDRVDFVSNLKRLGELTDQDTSSWSGMIEAHRLRRAHFREHGATASDHGVPTAQTLDLNEKEKQNLLTRLTRGEAEDGDAEKFRAQMLTEMALLSCEDGMVMQLHAGARRGTDPARLDEFGPDRGADVPMRIDAVQGLEPLLQRCGDAPGFHLLFFCLDETTYARELAPLAGYWPALKIGPPWWFHDSPRGIARYLDNLVETAGFHNLAGFNDDTRALLSIPARHDVWRRSVCSFLAQMLNRKMIGQTDAETITHWLCYGAAKSVYKLDHIP